MSIQLSTTKHVSNTFAEVPVLGVLAMYGQFTGSAKTVRSGWILFGSRVDLHKINGLQSKVYGFTGKCTGYLRVVHGRFAGARGLYSNPQPVTTCGRTR